MPPSDEGGGFCEAKDGGRELRKALYINDSSQNQSLLQSLCDSFLVRGSLINKSHLLFVKFKNPTEACFFAAPLFYFITLHASTSLSRLHAAFAGLVDGRHTALMPVFG